MSSAGFDFLAKQAEKVTGNKYEYIYPTDSAFGRIVENGEKSIFYGSLKDAETFLAGFVQGYGSANQRISKLAHPEPKKAVSYVRLKNLLSNLRGARRSFQCQEDFDGYVRFVKRNGDVFSVGSTGEACLLFNYDAASQALCLSIGRGYTLDDIDFVGGRYYFPANEDIGEELADIIEKAWNTINSANVRG